MSWLGSAGYLARRAAQKERVRILYRWALKDSLNWAVNRHLFYQDALDLREKFDVKKHVEDLYTIDRLIDDAEATYEKCRHHDPSTLEHHFSLLQREIEKLRADNEKTHNELWQEISENKSHVLLEIHASRAQLEAANEKARIESLGDNEKTRNELRKEISENKFDVLLEIHASRPQLEAVRYQVIKYCIRYRCGILSLGILQPPTEPSMHVPPVELQICSH